MEGSPNKTFIFHRSMARGKEDTARASTTRKRGRRRRRTTTTGAVAAVILLLTVWFLKWILPRYGIYYYDTLYDGDGVYGSNISPRNDAGGDDFFGYHQYRVEEDGPPVPGEPGVCLYLNQKLRILPDECMDGVRTPATTSYAKNKTLAPFAFHPLPLGSIKPLGWLKDQMQLMADGLPGHEHDFYLYVKDNPWLGGHHEYSPLNEAFPYWFNGLVPLAYGLDNSRIKHQVLESAQYIISHQQSDGWLGPETDLRTRNFWARYPVFLGLTQLVEAEPQLATPGTVVPAMHRFVDLMHAMLNDNWQGFVSHHGDRFDQQWGRSRAADLVIALQWLYEKYPGGKHTTKKIWDCMTLIHAKAYDWSYWFSEDVFIKEDLDTVPVELTKGLFPYEHGVNAGQGLKHPAVFARLTHNLTLHHFARQGVNWTFSYHGTSSGAIIADEREAGLSPSRGVELCSVVETMFSLSYLYHSLGDNSFADRAELAAFNALPTMITPDWWGHQYLSTINQPHAHPLSQSPFWNVGPYGPMFGLHPNYPCCTVDFPQGYPKFLSASWTLRGDAGIAHVLLSPGSVSTTLPSGVEVNIVCSTNYPFHHTLLYSISASAYLQFYIRIPAWSDPASTMISLNGGADVRVKTDAHDGTHLAFIPPGRSVLTLKLSPSIQVVPRANDTVSIHHGSLMYVLPMTENAVPLPPSGGHYHSAPPQSHDWFIDPVSPDNLPPSAPNSTEFPWSWSWNMAIDPSTTSFHYKPSADEQLPNPIWGSDQPPVYMEALGCEIEWSVIGNGIPKRVPLKHQRKCVGEVRKVRLVPLGSARLHVGELPVMDLARTADVRKE